VSTTPTPNPIHRTAARLAIAAAACLAAVLVGAAIGGGAAIALGSIGGTAGLLLGLAAFFTHLHALRYDREQAMIDRGEALADWTLSADEWNAFVTRVQALGPKVTSRKRYRTSAAPVRVTLLPATLRWAGEHVMWGTASMRLVDAHHDPAQRWITLETRVVAADVEARHAWFVPVPEAEEARVPRLIERLRAGV